MTDLTAIDILVEPDEASLARAGAENARLRAQAPEGFRLDADHRPHLTLLQRYVRTAALDDVFGAVEQIVKAQDPEQLSFQASAIRHIPVAALPGTGIAAIVATPVPGVLAVQRALIEALAPFTATGGTASAFETTSREPTINADTLAYVERYVPDHSGDNFVAHMTVGLAPLAFLEAIEAGPFDGFKIHASAMAVFKLGNNGTARRQLRAWPTVGLGPTSAAPLWQGMADPRGR